MGIIIIQSEDVQRSQGGETQSVEVFPGIWKTPGVCGGKARVGRHRITVSGLLELKQLGCSDEKLLDAYPTMTHGDLSAAWKYARLNASEIEVEIRENNVDD